MGRVVTMAHQQAVTVVPASMATVERLLRDVSSWPRFISGLEDVTETSHCRYRFVIRDGAKTREADIAVITHLREHRIIWHSLSGARFDGEVRLRPVDGRHTRVSLSLTADPVGFLAGLSEFLTNSTVTATLDLQLLEKAVLDSQG
jgi:uncharacterized membrane protein